MCSVSGSEGPCGQKASASPSFSPLQSVLPSDNQWCVPGPQPSFPTLAPLAWAPGHWCNWGKPFCQASWPGLSGPWSLTLPSQPTRYLVDGGHWPEAGGTEG